MVEPAPAPRLELRCAEIWGGVSVKEDEIATPGVFAAIHSSASGDSKGGDVYYFSVCAYDALTRIVVADVRGHGAAVSCLSEWLYQELESRMNDPDGSAVLAGLNRVVRARGFEAITTAAVATLNRDQGWLHYSYAGHPPIYLWRNQSGWRPLAVSEGKGPSNLPLGVLPNTAYTQERVRVEPGDRLFLYSDGVSECPGPEGELFGDEALLGALHRSADLPLMESRHAIRQELVRYSGGPLEHDDCTFLLTEVREPVPFWKRRILPGRGNRVHRQP